MIHLIYMAAGNSSRYGSNKLLQNYNGKAMFRHTLDLLLDLQKDSILGCCLSITVVSRYPEIKQYVDEAAGKKAQQSDIGIGIAPNQGEVTDIPEKKLRYADSPDSPRGVSFTIRSGINALLEEGIGADDYLAFFVADQPKLKRTTIERFLHRIRRVQETGERSPVSLSFEGCPGNPCAFPAAFVPNLLSLQGDRGGRSILQSTEIIYVETESVHELMDIDFPDYHN